MALHLTACVVDLGSGAVVRGGERTRLTSREREVLAYLAARPGRTVPRDELHAEVWRSAPAVSPRACDGIVRRLREKLEADPERPDHVLTVHGTGYRFVLSDGPVVAAPAVRAAPLVLGPVTVDLGRGRAFRPDGPAELTAREVAILQRLASAAGRSVPADALLRDVWGGEASRTVLSSAVWRLRAKVELGDAPRFLRTAGDGYRLEVAGAPRISAPDLVGRDALVRRIREAVAGRRFTLLVGPAGVGKTQLARAVAAAAVPPPWWVDAAGATSPASLAAAIARALSAELGGGGRGGRAPRASRRGAPGARRARGDRGRGADRPRRAPRRRSGDPDPRHLARGARGGHRRGVRGPPARSHGRDRAVRPGRPRVLPIVPAAPRRPRRGARARRPARRVAARRRDRGVAGVRRHRGPAPRGVRPARPRRGRPAAHGPRRVLAAARRGRARGADRPRRPRGVHRRRRVRAVRRDRDRADVRAAAPLVDRRAAGRRARDVDDDAGVRRRAAGHARGRRPARAPTRDRPPRAARGAEVARRRGRAAEPGGVGPDRAPRPARARGPEGAGARRAGARGAVRGGGGARVEAHRPEEPALRLLDEVLASPAIPPLDRAVLTYHRAAVDPDRAEVLRIALVAAAMAVELGAPWLAARAHHVAGIRHEDPDRLELAAKYADEAGDAVLAAFCRFNLSRGAETARALLEASRRGRDGMREALAAEELGRAARDAGRSAEALAWYDQALDAWGPAPSALDALRVRIARVQIELDLSDDESVADEARDLERRSAADPAAIYGQLASAFLGSWLLRQGRVDEARCTLLAARRRLAPTPIGRMSGAHVGYELAQVYLATGDAASASAVATESAFDGLAIGTLCRLAAAGADAARGDPTAPDRAAPHIAALGDHPRHGPRVRAWECRIAADLGDPEGARIAYAAFREAVRRIDAGSAAAFRALDAELARRTGRR